MVKAKINFAWTAVHATYGTIIVHGSGMLEYEFSATLEAIYNGAKELCFDEIDAAVQKGTLLEGVYNIEIRFTFLQLSTATLFQKMTA